MYHGFDGYYAPTLYAAIGFESVDIWGGVGTTGVPGGAPGAYLDLMPRLFASDTFAVAPRVMYVTGTPDATLSFEAHHVAHAGSFWMTSNVAWRPTIGDAGFQKGSLVGLFGPELYVTDGVSLSVEIDVTMGLASAAFGLSLAPAVAAQLDADAHTSPRWA